MTPGTLNRDILKLEGRVKGLETSGAVFTEAQIAAIAKRYADRTFRRLIAWSAASAFVGGALVVLAYLAK